MTRLFQRAHGARALAFTAIGALALSACGGEGEGADGRGDDNSVKVAVFPSFNALGARAADVEGSFEEQGLDVEFVTVATPAEATPQLIGGKVDFALMDVSSPVIARSENVPLVMVAPGAVGTKVPDDGFGVGNFWVRKDSKISSVKDIENATFGIPQTKSQIWIDMRTIVDEAGGDSSKTKFVEVPNTLAALKSGSVDVVTTSEPAGTAALKEKKIKPLEGFVTGKVGEVGYTYISTEKYTSENSETTEKFEKAILDGNSKVNADEGLAADVAGSYMDVPKPILDKSRYPKFAEDPVDADVVEQSIDRVLRYGLIKEDDAPSPEDMLVE